MTSDDDDVRALAPTARSVLSENDVSQWFHQRADLTYRTIENLTISKADAFQSLFTGSLLRKARFQEVIFSRSDLDGIRAERCEFSDCDFSLCDIRSSHFTKCAFINCKLSDCYVDACEFVECELAKCSFQNSSVTHSIFSNTKLDKCELGRSTQLHNRYYDCTIEQTTLGDCTFLYAIFRDCTLVNVILNAESVGAILGLTRKQVSESPSIYLGEVQGRLSPADDVAKLFMAEYQKRRWYLGELVLNLNFGSSSIIEAFRRYFANTSSRTAEMGFVKSEELEFLAEIVEELASQSRLPFLTVMTTLEWCSSIERLVSTETNDSQKRANLVRLLATRTTFVANTLLEMLAQASQVLDLRSDERITLKAKFGSKPSVPLVETVNLMASASGLPGDAPTTFIRAELGSYTEWVWTTLFSAFAFQVFLFLINGCVIQLTELKQRAKLLTRSKAASSYSQLALTPVQHASPAVISVVQQLASFTKNLPLLANPDLSGFGAANVKSLEVENTGFSDHKRGKPGKRNKSGSRSGRQ